MSLLAIHDIISKSSILFLLWRCLIYLSLFVFLLALPFGLLCGVSSLLQQFLLRDEGSYLLDHRLPAGHHDGESDVISHLLTVEILHIDRELPILPDLTRHL